MDTLLVCSIHLSFLSTYHPHPPMSASSSIAAKTPETATTSQNVIFQIFWLIESSLRAVFSRPLVTPCHSSPFPRFPFSQSLLPSEGEVGSPLLLLVISSLGSLQFTASTLRTALSTLQLIIPVGSVLLVAAVCAAVVMSGNSLGLFVALFCRFRSTFFHLFFVIFLALFRAIFRHFSSTFSRHFSAKFCMIFQHFFDTHFCQFFAIFQHFFRHSKTAKKC